MEKRHISHIAWVGLAWTYVIVPGNDNIGESSGAIPIKWEIPEKRG